MGNISKAFFDSFDEDTPTLRTKIQERCYLCSQQMYRGMPRLVSAAGVEVCEECCAMFGIKTNA